MENKIQPPSSPSTSPEPSMLRSSLTAELFGDDDIQSSSTGIFSSIFPPPSTVLARNTNSSHFNGAMQKEKSESQVWTITHGTSAENEAKNTASANSSTMNKDRWPFEQRPDPSPLSSSLYYGGQEDMYVCSSSKPNSHSYSKFKKSDGKDDPNHFWWEGSLYY
ncbi:uncharacterized protein [Rutidosis leptorrhynchoides]|uniref:uncharacterized protein n=1 Tax=Rutidosis leptorrhynchoides TaxID=125765 RepID=UPI003A9A0E98